LRVSWPPRSSFADLLVRQMVHQFEQFGIFAEEMFARVAARLDEYFW
jgi:hypothetical protein